MALMNHGDILPVGVPAIDDQHLQLIGVVNDMYEEIATCHSLEEERVITGRFIEELKEYARIHFEAEERMMSQYNYPKFSQHETEHRLFINELQRILLNHVTGELAMSFNVFTFARDWIANHINVSDQEYKKFLK